MEKQLGKIIKIKIKKLKNEICKNKRTKGKDSHFWIIHFLEEISLKIPFMENGKLGKLCGFELKKLGRGIDWNRKRIVLVCT